MTTLTNTIDSYIAYAKLCEKIGLNEFNLRNFIINS